MIFKFKTAICLLLTVVFGLTSKTLQKTTSAHTFSDEREALNLTTISQFDHLSRTLCDSTDWDWKFILAIASAESNFRTDVSSHRGATGLMQIMPHTAGDLGYTGADLTDPEVSIEIALKLLDRIKGTLRFSPSTPERERLSIILASYNAGLGYVLRTRKAAHSDGQAYNNWDTLKGYITRNGTHRETVEYVDKVLKRYDKYKNI